MMLVGAELLEHFIAVGPYLKEVFGKDIMVGITDREKFLAYYPGEKIDVGVKIGQKVPKEDPIIKAMEIKQNIITNVPKEAYGFSFKSSTTPILENGEAIGCIGIAVSMEQEVKVIEVADILRQSMEQVTAAIQQIAASAGEISTSEQKLYNEIELIAQTAGEINKILGFIKNIADQTKILGINAAIEAARAGEHGRGFAVVADEVRKLAEEAASSSKQIAGLAQAIQGETARTVEGIQRSAADAEESAAAVARSGELLTAILRQIGEITATIREVSRGLETINAGSQELAAATEEQSASMETIAGAAQELSTMAERLQQLVQEFELGGGDAGKE